MAGNRRRKRENSGMHAFLYVLVVLVLLCGMGYLFYYSRSQAKERQEYIKELESKEMATKDFVEVTIFEEPESETESEADSSMSEVQTETQTEPEPETEPESETSTQTETSAEVSMQAESESESQAIAEGDRVIVLNGTGKSGVASYWKRFLQMKGVANIVIADYKGSVGDRTVVYVAEGSDAPEGVYDCFPNAEYREGSLEESDPESKNNIKAASDQTEYETYDVWIVVGKDDALHD
jgi:flagellar basal body-associated protein FliL